MPIYCVLVHTAHLTQQSTFSELEEMNSLQFIYLFIAHLNCKCANVSIECSAVRRAIL